MQLPGGCCDSAGNVHAPRPMNTIIHLRACGGIMPCGRPAPNRPIHRRSRPLPGPARRQATTPAHRWAGSVWPTTARRQAPRRRRSRSRGRRGCAATSPTMINAAAPAGVSAWTPLPDEGKQVERRADGRLASGSLPVIACTMRSWPSETITRPAATARHQKCDRKKNDPSQTLSAWLPRRLCSPELPLLRGLGPRIQPSTNAGASGWMDGRDEPDHDTGQERSTRRYCTATRSFKLSDLSWPQAAMMSRPRGVRTGLA